MKTSLFSLFAALAGCLLPGSAQDVVATDSQLTAYQPVEVFSEREGIQERVGSLYLTLREPVVSLTVVENALRVFRGELDAASLSPADLGLDILDVEGEVAPQLQWVEQNCLRISFAPGSSVKTLYKLRFKPGTTYLGGAPLAKSHFSFRRPPSSLSVDFLPQQAGGAALLTAADSNSREACELPQQHEGVSVRFRRMRRIPLVDEWVPGEAIEAYLCPATVADGMTHATFAALLKQHGPKAISSATPLPNSLLALPTLPLQPGAGYRVEVHATPECGFLPKTTPIFMTGERMDCVLRRAADELPRPLAPGGEAAAKQGNEPIPLRLYFSHPVAEAELRELWGALAVRLNGAEAQRTAGGSYQAEVNGQPVRLRLKGLLPCRADSVSARWQNEQYFYNALADYAQGFELELSSTQALELAISVPAGVQGLGGHKLADGRALRMSILPACPAMTGNGSNMLSWHGEHCLRLPYVNAGRVTATAYRWEADDAARLLPILRANLRDDTPLRELEQRLAWLHHQAQCIPTARWQNVEERRNLATALKYLHRERREMEPLRAKALARAKAFPAQELELQAAKGGSALVTRGEALLDVDKLTGGQVKPGLYLVSLTAEGSEAVQRASAPLMPGVETSCTVDYLVQVTDISPKKGGNRLLLRSLATGEVLDGVRITPYTRLMESNDELYSTEARPEADATFTVQRGNIELTGKLLNRLLLLQQGEDYSLLLGDSHEIGFVSPRRQAADGELIAPPIPVVETVTIPDEYNIELFCDRPLYRPGETAHLRGIVRRNEAGQLISPKEGELIRLTLERPNGDDIETQHLKLDAYGAFSADVCLPAGEEDSTGEFICLAELENGSGYGEIDLPCEVFRRDAFEAKLECDVAPVAPERFRITVRAHDYNGTPVAGGKVKLSLSSPGVPMGDADAPKGTPPHNICSRVLPLDAQGQAVYEGKLPPFDRAGQLTIAAVVSNEREEFVKLAPESVTLSPADFTISLEGEEEEHRLRLLDTRSKRVLDREQELQLRVTVDDTEHHRWPNGITRVDRVNRTLLERRITIPANCEQGMPVKELLQGAELPTSDITLEFKGCDADGHPITYSTNYYGHCGYARDREPKGQLRFDGRELVYRPENPQAGTLQLYISSQERMRYELATLKDGEQELRIPLTAAEFGSVTATLVSCEKDHWGHYTHWQSLEAEGELERVEKKLAVELTVPQGAKPGAGCLMSGRVTDAAGKPVRAAVTLFAVDAGMLSVAPYRLPQLLATFYHGHSEGFRLNAPGSVHPCCPPLCLLPNFWEAETYPHSRSLPAAYGRSICPRLFADNTHWYYVNRLSQMDMHGIIRSTDDKRLLPVPGIVSVDFDAQYAPEAPVQLNTGFVPYARGSAVYSVSSASAMQVWGADKGMGVASPCVVESDAEEDCAMSDEKDEGGAAPRLRRNFAPTALWVASLETEEDGSFRTEATLPDSLTTYRVFAVALSADKQSFGQGESEFLVNQKLMLSAGTPFFMSLGDKLQLPLTITNNSEQAGRWSVTLKEEGATQQVELAAHESRTLLFEVTAQEEGERVLTWSATGEGEGDAMEASFPVYYPAPLLKEHHRLALKAGQTLDAAGLLAPELAASTRGSITLEYAASPLLHFSGALDYLLTYPYGCTEQTASALLPWLYYDKLAPYCPQMSKTSKEKVRSTITQAINTLLARQQEEDGGLAYWGSHPGEEHPSSPWASAYAALVLTIAEEQGYKIPSRAMDELHIYLDRQDWTEYSPLVRYAAARALGDEEEVASILADALKQAEEAKKQCWRDPRGTIADLRFIAEVSSKPAERHEALLRWMRVQGRDYRHPSTWSSGWQLVALGEYLRHDAQGSEGTSLSINGEAQEVRNAPARVEWKAEAGKPLAATAPKLAAQGGLVYVTVKAKAQPEQTDYPGVTEKGLQITRVYETRGADGLWRPATEWKVGEVVRVTLTCAKIADELMYLVLEDKLPSTLECINPRVPGQAAGLEDNGEGEWSPCIDHKEYLADRVRAFSTRWWGRELINMRYYARVKRAGTAIAPPAEAQLMYEPQVYGLSPNTGTEAR